MSGRTCHLSWMNVAIAQCLVPGRSMTLRSRRTVFGQSSRNDASELARPVVDADSAGEPVPDALKMNCPRGPPASCVCRSISVFFRHSPPNLMVCVFISFVTDETTFHVRPQRSHGWLAEKPKRSPLSPYPPMLMVEMPLVYWSRLAPGMPTSVLVVRPSPVVIVVLR